MTETAKMVKVGLHAPDDEFETMWATPVGPDHYRLENPPFYAYGVSWLDVVEARPVDGTGLLNRPGQYSIRINDQWRVCFRWKDGDAFDVEIVDYH